jgi:uncharacterized protein DUF4199
MTMHLRRKHIALTYGCIAGICMILLMSILYKAGVQYYLGPVAYLGYAILIGLATAAALSEKRAGDGYLEFRAALKTCFTVFVIGLAAQTLFIWVLVNILDLHFKTEVTQAILQNEENFFRRGGMSEDLLESYMAKERGKDQFTLGGMIMGLFTMYIVHFLIALVIAAIVKKKKPVFSDAGI